MSASFPHNSIDVALGAVFRLVRQEADLTQLELASKLGECQTTVSAVELGYRKVTVSYLTDFERVLRLPKGTILRRAGLVD